MDTIPYVAPQFNANAFNCPHPDCRAYSQQIWWSAYGLRNGSSYTAIQNLRYSACTCCGKLAYWQGGNIIYPRARGAGPANADMPPDIINDYNEAALIENESPRGAAALLRLCIQKICKTLGEKGANINDDIASLVAKGLPDEVRQALDVVRVIGNSAVHPGQIDLRDNKETVAALFVLVNLISERMISMPKQVQALHSSLPPGIQAAIAKRDGPKP